MVGVNDFKYFEASIVTAVTLKKNYKLQVYIFVFLAIMDLKMLFGLGFFEIFTLDFGYFVFLRRISEY